MAERVEAEDLARLGALIDAWAAKELVENELLTAVDHDPAERRWFVRMTGEDKAVITVWLSLRERTLHAETFLMPHPEENVAETWEYLLRASGRLYGYAPCIGLEDAVYLRAQCPLEWLDEEELDRLVGSAWQYSEALFRNAMLIGYASKYVPPGTR